jgi:hypothetical protein
MYTETDLLPITASEGKPLRNLSYPHLLIFVIEKLQKIFTDTDGEEWSLILRAAYQELLCLPFIWSKFFMGRSAPQQLTSKIFEEFVTPGATGGEIFNELLSGLSQDFQVVVAALFLFHLQEETGMSFPRYLTLGEKSTNPYVLLISLYKDVFYPITIDFFQGYKKSTSESECIDIMCLRIFEQLPEYKERVLKAPETLGDPNFFVHIFGVSASFLTKLSRSRNWSSGGVGLQMAAEKKLGLVRREDPYQDFDSALEFMSQKILCTKENYRRPIVDAGDSFQTFFDIHPKTLDFRMRKHWGKKISLLDLVKQAETNAGLISTEVMPAKAKIPANYQKLIQFMAQKILNQGESYVRPLTSKSKTVFDFTLPSFLEAAQRNKWAQHSLAQAINEAETLALQIKTEQNQKPSDEAEGS